MSDPSLRQAWRHPGRKQFLTPDVSVRYHSCLPLKLVSSTVTGLQPGVDVRVDVTLCYGFEVVRFVIGIFVSYGPFGYSVIRNLFHFLWVLWEYNACNPCYQS